MFANSVCNLAGKGDILLNMTRNVYYTTQLLIVPVVCNILSIDSLGHGLLQKIREQKQREIKNGFVAGLIWKIEEVDGKHFFQQIMHKEIVGVLIKTGTYF